MADSNNILGELDTLKVVLFIEPTPLTDKFQQVALNQDAYRRILLAIENEMEHEGLAFRVVTNEKQEHIFTDIKAFYSKPELDSFSEDYENRE